MALHRYNLQQQDSPLYHNTTNTSFYNHTQSSGRIPGVKQKLYSPSARQKELDQENEKLRAQIQHLEVLDEIKLILDVVAGNEEPSQSTTREKETCGHALV